LTGRVAQPPSSSNDASTSNGSVRKRVMSLTEQVMWASIDQFFI
jgi:hypothetical protein